MSQPKIAQLWSSRKNYVYVRYLILGYYWQTTSINFTLGKYFSYTTYIPQKNRIELVTFHQILGKPFLQWLWRYLNVDEAA